MRAGGGTWGGVFFERERDRGWGNVASVLGLVLVLEGVGGTGVNIQRILR